MTHTQRIAELGIELPGVAAPVAAYVPATRVGDLVHTSGQLPFVDGELPATGHVGAEVDEATAKDLARTAALNAIAAVGSVADIDDIEQVVKVTGFVSSAPGFHGQPGVINGASELFGEVFGDSGAHARSAVGVSELPLNSPVEVEISVKLRG